MKKLIKAIAPQILILSIMLVLNALSWVSILPSSTEISRDLTTIISKHGLPFVILSSFLENFAGIGAYFPGSLALLASMMLTAGNPNQAMLTYFAVLVPAIGANIASYGLGRMTGRRNQEASKRSSKLLILWYIGTYWHPQLAGITAMASGAESVPFLRYLGSFLPISLGWSVLWALFLYNAGGIIDMPKLLIPISYIYIICWLLWDVWRMMRKSVLSSQKLH
ncbi:MAG: hypothetical protein JXA73_11345 [Acidobacteria bacterium]|nr:hypothetical protein [Acidobacteriota bacterium]